MPTYSFLDTTTNETFTTVMTMAEREEFLSNNPNIQQQLATPSFSRTAAIGKPDDGFRDRLREIKKTHSRGLTKSTIDTF